MPWNKVTPMEEITRFVMLAQSDRFTVTELWTRIRRGQVEHLNLDELERRGRLITWLASGRKMRAMLFVCSRAFLWR